MTAVFVFTLALPGAFSFTPGASFIIPTPTIAHEKNHHEIRLKNTNQNKK
jgi:hypothetical protein